MSQVVFILRAIAACGAVFLPYVIIVTHWLVVRRLRAEHGDLWQRLGCPTLVFNTLKTWDNILRFIWAREFQVLSDPLLASRCRREAFLAKTWAACFVLSIAGLIVQIFTSVF